MAASLKVEEIGDHTFRVTLRDKSRVGPPREFLTPHLQGYVQGEITKSVREVSAKVDFLSDQLKTVETDLNAWARSGRPSAELNADRLPEDAALTRSSRHTLEARRADLLAEIHRLREISRARKHSSGRTARGPRPSSRRRRPTGSRWST